MKQFEPKQKKIGENTFYIFPFPAFKAANLSGEIVSLIAPLVASLGGTLGNAENPIDVDLADAAPTIAEAFSSLSGDKLERLLKKLLTENKNIAVDVEGEDDPVRLTDDLVNEIFCGETQDMFMLAFEVIKLNYSGFFEKISARSGSVLEKAKVLTASKSTED